MFCCIFRMWYDTCLYKKQLEKILGNLKEKPDVGTLLLALQRTLEFEDELAEKFGGGTQNREIGNEIEEIGRGANSRSSASDILHINKLAMKKRMEVKIWQCLELGRRHGIFRREVRIVYYLVACR